MQKFVLEKSPLFPYIAWTMVLSFSFLVFSLAQDLKSTAQHLEQNTTALETVAKQNAADIDFNLPQE